MKKLYLYMFRQNCGREEASKQAVEASGISNDKCDLATSIPGHGSAAWSKMSNYK